MEMYQHWAENLCPSVSFEEFLIKCERFARSPLVRVRHRSLVCVLSRSGRVITFLCRPWWILFTQLPSSKFAISWAWKTLRTATMTTKHNLMVSRMTLLLRRSSSVFLLLYVNMYDMHSIVSMAEFLVVHLQLLRE